MKTTEEFKELQDFVVEFNLKNNTDFRISDKQDSGSVYINSFRIGGQHVKNYFNSLLNQKPLATAVYCDYVCPICGNEDCGHINNGRVYNLKAVNFEYFHLNHTPVNHLNDMSGNFSPQNSGAAMLYIGYSEMNYAKSKTIRSERAILDVFKINNLLDIPFNIKLMKVTEVEEVHPNWRNSDIHKKRACKWEWIDAKKISIEKVIQIIDDNKKMLDYISL